MVPSTTPAEASASSWVKVYTLPCWDWFYCPLLAQVASVDPLAAISADPELAFVAVELVP